MARVIKVDNADKKRFARNEKKQTLKSRNKKQYFLIVCEGEKTEPFYFKSLKNTLPPGSVDVEIQGEGKNTVSLIEEIIKNRKKIEKNNRRPFDQTWAVFDKDDFPNQDFDEAIRFAEENQIKCAWSNEAFELWYLLHFEFVNVPMRRGDHHPKLESFIRKKGKIKFKYAKNDEDMYRILNEVGDQEKAIDHAKKLLESNAHLNPSQQKPATTVHKLIQALKEIAE